MVNLGIGIENVATGVLSFVNWGITIIVFMIIVEIYKAVTHAGGGELASRAGKKIWKYVPGTEARAKRVTKKEMNEYIMEEQEEQMLEDIKHDISNILTSLDVLQKKPASASPGEEKSESKKFVKLFENLGDKIKDARKYFRSLNKRTFRSQKGVERLFDYMKEKGVKDDQLVQKVKVLEGTILKLHEETAKEVGKAEAEYEGIGDLNGMRLFKAFKSNSISGSMYDNLRQGFEAVESIVGQALQHQTKAKQELQGLIALTRQIFK